MALENDSSDHLSAADTDLWVFRDGKKTVAGKRLLDELLSSLQHLLQDRRNKTLQLDVLIRAGEFESAVGDCGFTTPTVTHVTDAVAELAVADKSAGLAAATFNLQQFVPPQTVVISPPEGFSYYALHPLDFAKAVEDLGHNACVAVIGIRSIGTTLGAVATAALRRSGRVAERITVRPTGHPYERSARFNSAERQWIIKQQQQHARFLIVDEGPGRSGSTFLAVAEALLETRVPVDAITLMGSRVPDLDLLCASNARERFSRFRFVCARGDDYFRFRDCTYLGGGEWRRIFLANSAEWPASWMQVERVKFLSPDRKQLFKFEGLGPMGIAARERALHIAEAGFGGEVDDAGDGFASYRFLGTHSLKMEDVSTPMLNRIAAYCAFRSPEFRVSEPVTTQLPEMVVFNVAQELGIEVGSISERLHTESPTIVDGRMQPYEWVVGDKGLALKTDASMHGDDHFFPGPTDIAWDIAGTAVEWGLHADALGYLLSRYRQLSGDNVLPRISIFTLAYAVLRLAACKMAMTTVPGSAEAMRLHTAYLFYRAKAQHIVHQIFPAQVANNVLQNCVEAA